MLNPNRGVGSLLVITGTWPPMACGVGDYTARLCQHLADRGLQIRVLTSVSVRPLLAGNSMLKVLPVITHWSWGMLRILQATIREWQPEVILFEWPTASYGRSLAVNWIPVFIKRNFPGISLVTTLHELRYFKPITRWRIWPALKYSDRLVLVDPLDASCVAGLHAAAEKKCCHIPIGSNIPAVGLGFKREQKRRELGIAPHDFVVVFFGFVNPPKGLEELLAALAIQRKKRADIKFMLLAQLDDRNAYQHEIQRKMQEAGLEAETVRSAFYQEPEITAEWLACADCAVLPFRDGASLKRGSLMACLEQGLPVISTTPQLGAELGFLHGKNILLVEPGSALAIANALERLQGDPLLRRSLTQGARILMQRFDWPRIAQQYEEIIHTCGRNKI